MKYDVAVIGVGLIGSAASKYLAARGLRVVGIGSPEPSDYSLHDDVLSSHYDDGRVCRILDTDEVWARLAQASMERFLEIEKRSGITFLHSGGCLKVGDDQYVHDNKIVGDKLQVNFKVMNADERSKQIPSMRTFGLSGLWEEGLAGYIAPKLLIRAQRAVAEQCGAKFLDQVATKIDWRKDYCQIETKAGEKLIAKQILLATGAFTNFHELLPFHVPLTIKAETVICIEVSKQSLLDLPSSFVISKKFSDTMPYLYGTWHKDLFASGSLLKVGTQNDGKALNSLSEIVAFFREGGNPGRAKELMEASKDLIPLLTGAIYHSKPCIISYPVGPLPYIDEVIPGRAFLVAGCCGTSAKSSDELGRLACERLFSDAGYEQYKIIDLPGQTNR